MMGGMERGWGGSISRGGWGSAGGVGARLRSGEGRIRVWTGLWCILAFLVLGAVHRNGCVMVLVSSVRSLAVLEVDVVKRL